jgi:hypothetical protein
VRARGWSTPSVNLTDLERLLSTFSTSLQVSFFPSFLFWIVNLPDDANVLRCATCIFPRAYYALIIDHHTARLQE